METDRLDPTVAAPEAGPEPPRRRGLLLGAVLGGTGLLAALLAFGLTRDPTAIRSPLIGRPAPPFELPALEGGGTVGLSDLRGQVVVLNFWASWCAPCRQEHPDLARAWERFRDRGVVVVGVLYQDTPEAARRYVEELGGGWPLARDPGGRTAIAYGVYGIPETYFIAPDGTVAFKHVGAISYDVLEDRILELLEEPGA
ncbi:MAG TPA: TlpA disulfide reductase family protein [Actinomycetota bacterium]|nr:TlpA disulfide reductase family protein [Actinomycetota bacterium]